MAIHAYTTALAYSEVGSVYTTIACIIDIKGPASTANAIDITCQSSPNFHKQFMQGMVDAGEVSVTLMFDWEEYQFLYDTVLTGGEDYHWRITTPEGDTIRWMGFITNLSPAFPMDDKITLDLTLKCAGKLTLTDAL